MEKILKMLGFGQSSQDQALKQLVSGSYESVQVVGRGTIKIDPTEVRKSEEFKKARKQAKSIVNAS